MGKVVILKCFHSEKSYPKKKYISKLRRPLLCGTDLHDFDYKDIYKDNTGENISIENSQYSELTGYFWAWHNLNTDYIGMEHYGRHFIKHVPYFNDDVKKEFLLDEKDILSILSQYDFIVPVHESQNESIYELYLRCFGEAGVKMLVWILRFFHRNNLPNYEEAALRYFSHNRVYRANLLMTSKKEFDNYCLMMFSMINYIKDRMAVEPNSRVWGYLTEVFPMVYILANNKTFKEVDTAVDIAECNWEIEGEKVHTTLANLETHYTGNPDYIVAGLKEMI
jgi:hypothetical protein